MKFTQKRLLIFNTLHLLQERKANFHMRDVSLQWSDYTRQNLISLVLIFHFQEFDFTTKFLKQLSWGVLKQLYTTLWKTATSLKNTCGVVSHGLKLFKVTKKNQRHVLGICSNIFSIDYEHFLYLHHGMNTTLTHKTVTCSKYTIRTAEHSVTFAQT